MCCCHSDVLRCRAPSYTFLKILNISCYLQPLRLDAGGAQVRLEKEDLLGVSLAAMQVNVVVLLHMADHGSSQATKEDQ